MKFHIGVFIKRYRVKSGLTQLQLSKKMGFKNGQFISNIERGNASLPFFRAKTLCKILKINHKLLLEILIIDYKRQMRRGFR